MSATASGVLDAPAKLRHVEVVKGVCACVSHSLSLSLSLSLYSGLYLYLYLCLCLRLSLSPSLFFFFSLALSLSLDLFLVLGSPGGSRRPAGAACCGNAAAAPLRESQHCVKVGSVAACAHFRCTVLSSMHSEFIVLAIHGSRWTPFRGCGGSKTACKL